MKLLDIHELYALARINGYDSPFEELPFNRLYSIQTWLREIHDVHIWVEPLTIDNQRMYIGWCVFDWCTDDEVVGYNEEDILPLYEQAWVDALITGIEALKTKPQNAMSN
jgi:hypothetical protein